MSANTLQIRSPFRFTRKHMRGIKFCCSRKLTHYIGFFGDYGVGKSTAAGATYVRFVGENGFNSGLYLPGAEPMSGIVGPSYGDLIEGPIRILRQLLPNWKELVVRERYYGSFWDILWVNGHRTVLVPLNGELNGVDWTHAWCTEFQDAMYTNEVYKNVCFRVREKRAQRLGVILDGLALKNHVEARFKGKQSKPNYCVCMLSFDDNRHNFGGSVIDDMLEDLPASYFERDDEGWQVPQGIRFTKFGARNFVTLPNAKESPIHISADLRKHSAVLFGVKTSLMYKDEEVKNVGYLLDELCPENESTSRVAALTKKRCEEKGYVLNKHSTITLDPTLAIEEVEAWEEAFPKIQIVQHKKGTFSTVKAGLDAVDTVMENGKGEVKLFAHPSLDHTGLERGVVRTIRNWKGNKDGKFEHMGDTLRGWVCTVIPPTRELQIGNVSGSDRTNAFAKLKLNRHHA